MNQRVAHRANNHEIFFFIVSPIAIFMMNSKNFFNFIIAAFFTFIYSSSIFHIFSKTLFCGLEFCMERLFRCARTTTKTSVFAWRIHKFNFAKKTCIFFGSAIKSKLRTIIAFSRTIFSFVTSRGNMIKNFAAYCAICYNFFSTTKFIFTFSGTPFKGFQSVCRHVAFFATAKTIQNFTSSRFIHAAP